MSGMHLGRSRALKVRRARGDTWRGTFWRVCDGGEWGPWATAQGIELMHVTGEYERAHKKEELWVVLTPVKSRDYVPKVQPPGACEQHTGDGQINANQAQLLRHMDYVGDEWSPRMIRPYVGEFLEGV